MNDDRVVSIAQLQAFLKGVDGAMEFHPETKGNKNKQKMYEWIAKVFVRFRYWSIRKKERGIILSYIVTMTKRSRVQIKRLAKRKKVERVLIVRTGERNTFPTVYTTSDIARLIETDNAHGRISGEATTAIMRREYALYGKISYERIRHVSVAHLYRIRGKSRQYQSQALHMEKTRSVQRDIGIRMKPETSGQPGHIRVDSVHQGDRDKEKGVYHINLVDEVTQWEIIGCVEGISEQFLVPLLLELIAQFPFVILGFHSDNGSEYINKVTAALLNTLHIKQTKSRSRRTNDNALVEGKNGSRIRKHMGYCHIPKRYARAISRFYREHMNIYCNFHRPCGFASLKIDHRGKEKKIYDIYLTPFEKLTSLPNWTQYLKDGVTPESLHAVAVKESDNECAAAMQKAKQELFKNPTR